MKKITLTIILALLLVLFTGCGNGKKENMDTNTDTVDETKGTDRDSKGELKEEADTEKIEDIGEIEETSFGIEDFFPLKENTLYLYEGEGNEYATYRVMIDFMEGNRIQQRIDNGGTQTVRVLEIKDGQALVLFSQGETYYRENMLKKSDTVTEVLLKEPLVEGTKWTLADGSERYISKVDVSVTTPSGDYQAIEVTTEYEDSTMVDYYAKGVGFIKNSFTTEGAEITSALESVIKDSEFSQTVKIYYPNIDDDKVYVEDTEITYKTNDYTKEKLIEAIKTVGKEKDAVMLGDKVKLNSLYINKDNMVYADFSSELISQMNAGSGYESLILTSLTNTLGIYYGVEKVYITVDGNPYESGHIALLEGESFHVNTSNVVE